MRDPMNKILTIIEKLRELDQSASITQVHTLIYIATKKDRGEITQADLAETLRISQGMISRYLKALSTRTEDGPRLLSLERDPEDDTRKTIQLTPRGMKLVEDIITILKA